MLFQQRELHQHLLQSAVISKLHFCGHRITIYLLQLAPGFALLQTARFLDHNMDHLLR